MCKFCQSEQPQNHAASRRDFLKTAGVGIAAVALASPFAQAQTATKIAPGLPRQTGQAGKRTLIRGGSVLSMDAKVGDFAIADVLIEGKRILAIRPQIDAESAEIIDARGKIVMPGFIDTHHHLFQTALRSSLSNGLLSADGTPESRVNYMATIQGQLAPGYQPQDVYLSELFGSLSQLDAGVTTVHDISQIHFSPQHTDAALQALRNSGQRAVFSYSPSQKTKDFAAEMRRIQSQHFGSKDQLMTLVAGGEISAPNYLSVWKTARELGLPIATHVVAVSAPTFAGIAQAGLLGRDTLLIHMTEIDDASWKITADSGAGISFAVPIEMAMRHGTPPILQALSLGIEPSLSSDVECTMTADSFAQMRGAFTLQRMLVNQSALKGEPHPAPLTARDVIRFATQNGASDLWLGDKIGSLSPGKEADIVILDATALNVAPLNNVPGAVVTLMDRSNVETVMVAGRIRKWKGRLLDADIPKLTSEIAASRDRLFAAAKMPRNLFGD